MTRPLPVCHLRLVEPDGLNLYRSFEDQLAEPYEEEPASPLAAAFVIIGGVIGFGTLAIGAVAWFEPSLLAWAL